MYVTDIFLLLARVAIIWFLATNFILLRVLTVDITLV